MAVWVFIVRPVPSEVPVDARVRRALKALRRVYGLAAVHVDELPESAVAPAIGALNESKRRPRVQT